MKRTLSFILAALLLAAALVSCAGVEKPAISANIRITSSDAENAAAWLSGRLGDALTEKVVFGTDADGCGVDVSALEGDGYIIRDLGGEIALLARTSSGLDRAARRYAKAVEAGTPISDETYHEGYRVKRVEIAGRDVSEYTIFYEDGKYMKSAAKGLQKRIKKACGAELAISAETPAAPYIALRYVHDEALSTVGCRWSVTDDGLTLECSDGYVVTSPTFAVARFLEREFDWFGLTFGYEDLAPADLVSLPAGTSGSEANVFQFTMPYGDFSTAPDTFEHDYVEGSGNMSAIAKSCHGLQNFRFAGALSESPNHDWALDQPCYLDDYFFEESYADVSKYIEAKLASGAKIGVDFQFVDIAAGDNDSFCGCKACKARFRQELSVSGAIVDWANRLSDALDEVYPGLCYGIFAYAGSNRPPKVTVPNEHVYITYCFDGNCSAHKLDGSDCHEGWQDIGGIKGYTPYDNQFTYHVYLEDWLKLTKNVYVWYYGLDNGWNTMSFVHTVRDDMRYLRDVGVKGFFWQLEDVGYCTAKISRWLCSALSWDPDMTDEEYDAYYDRVLRVLYGDGGALIKEYVALQSRVYENGVCMTCWSHYWHNHMTIELFAAYFDDMFDLTEAALPLADTAKQEARLIRLSTECIYKGCGASYFTAFNAGDDERVAELCRRYALIDPRLRSIGVDMTKLGFKFDFFTPARGFSTDLEVEAWSEALLWLEGNNGLTDFMLVRPTRDMPERVAEALGR